MKMLITLLLAASLVIGTQVTAHAALEQAPKTEGRWRGPCSDWWLGENLTPAVWAQDPARGRQMMQRLIVCVFGVWAPGNSVKALYVMDRESSDYPWSVNSSSGCSGLFQMMLSYWPGRAKTYLWRGWFGPNAWPASVFDPRANAIVAARMVAAGGWGPWS
jgi:hypothetical protein